MIMVFLTNFSFLKIVLFLKIFILVNTESKFTILKNLGDKLMAYVVSVGMPLYSDLLKLYAFLPSLDPLGFSKHRSP